MKEGICAVAVPESEHSVLKHGTKSPPIESECVNRVKRLLNSIKHVTVNELTELVEAIASVNSKPCRS